MGAFDDIRTEGVQVHVAGEPWKRWAAPRTVDAQPGFRLVRRPEWDATQTLDRGLRDDTAYFDAATGLRATAHQYTHPDTPIVRRWVTIRNDGTAPFALDVLHAAFIGNIAWDDPEALRLHVADNQNYAEAHWRSGSLASFGLLKTTKPNVGQIQFAAVGRSAQQHVPMAMLEDIRGGQTLVWQLEQPGSWLWDLGQGAAGELNLALGGLTETHHDWYRVLAPGASVSTFPVACGIVAGDAEDALAALTAYRRAHCRRPHPVDDACPVIFNDYMNCLGGNPTPENSMPLIQRAAAAGSQVYCIDAGWYGSGGWDLGIGDWYEDPARFPDGLNALMTAIEQSGMIPGLWVEIEAVSIWSETAKQPDAWFLRRHGHRIVFSDRYLLDFRNPDVQTFADATLDRLIREYRLGYIKFDYNCSPLLGPDHDAESSGAALQDHLFAVLDWYRRLRARHPRVILENCASGGMRNEYAMLSILQLASVSDQPDYRHNPAIVSGSLAAVLPEQLGVWTYPLKTDDREAAVFNMINALPARIHLSGQLAEISEECFAVVREGIACYRARIAPDLPHSLPVWPLGRIGMESTHGFQALGLHRPDRRSLWLAVWRLDSAQDTVSLPLTRWLGPAFRAEQVYPQTPVVPIKVAAGTLTVTLPRRYSARWLRVTVD